MSFRPPARDPDYRDRFAGPIGDNAATARELAQRATEASPFWFRAAFALRQLGARIVGLKTRAGGSDNGLPFLSDLPVLEDQPDRFRIGMGDRHLDFTLAVEKSGAKKAAKEISFTTEIWFNGWTGRAYLMLVLPIHKLILRRYVRSLRPGARR